ncbi:hypothetical protein PTKIN_Ptkin10aG0146800 [Pterospermum kingtungense]
MNTKYFHAVANGHRKNKKIERLQDDNGQWINDKEGLSGIVKNYFNNLFAPSGSSYEPIIENVRAIITDEDNQLLLAPFTQEEFKEALFSMNPDKAPGPDGFNPGFYQHFWPLIG